MIRTNQFITWDEVDDQVSTIPIYVATYRHPTNLPRLEVSAWYQWRPDTDQFHGEIHFEHDLGECHTLGPDYSFHFYYHETARAYAEVRIMMASELVLSLGTLAALPPVITTIDCEFAEPDDLQVDEPEPPVHFEDQWGPLIRDLGILLLFLLLGMWGFGQFLA